MDKNTKQRQKMIKDMKNYTLYSMDKYGKISVLPKELNFLQAFIMLVITLVLFTVIFPLAQRAMDIQAVHNCELRGDCSEVIRDINNK